MKTIQLSLFNKSLLAFLILLSVHCSSSAKQKDSTSTNPPLVLSYYSIGTGTPNDQPMKDFITSYRKKNKLKPIATTLIGGLGREGEHAYVFYLKEMNSKQRQKFISELSKALPTLKSKEEKGGINLIQNQPFDMTHSRTGPQTLEL